MPSPSSTGGGLMGSPSSVDTGLIPPVIISNDAADYSGNATVTLAGARLLCYAFELQGQATVLGGKWYMGATVTGTTNMGIYTLAGGNLIAGSDSGAITNVLNSVNSFTYGTPVTLSSGQYLMALSCSNATDTYHARSIPAINASHRGRLAANSQAAGVLPSTTGALSNTSNFPACSLTIQGGL